MKDYTRTKMSSQVCCLQKVRPLVANSQIWIIEEGYRKEYTMPKQYHKGGLWKKGCPWGILCINNVKEEAFGGYLTQKSYHKRGGVGFCYLMVMSIKAKGAHYLDRWCR